MRRHYAKIRKKEKNQKPNIGAKGNKIMKKITSLLLALLMLVSLVACGNDDDAKDTENNNSDTVNTADDTNDTAADTSADTEADTDAPEVAITDALEILTNVWNAYAEDDKFYPIGGDYDNMVDNAPGKFSLADAATVDSMLGLPESSVSMVDDAASLIHGMNTNTFTSAAFHLINADDAMTVAESFKENLANRRWMCGFPEKLLVISVEDYIITVFGHTEVIDVFVTNLTSVYPGATTIVEANIE